MCVGVDLTHVDCDHTTFLIAIRCADAARTGTDCVRGQCTFYHGEFTQPSLCIFCQQKAEKEIYDASEKVRLEITQSIDNIKGQLRKPKWNPEERLFLQDLLDKAVEVQNSHLRDVASKLSGISQSQGALSQDA